MRATKIHNDYVENGWKIPPKDMPFNKSELTGYETYNLSSYCDTHKIYDEIMKCLNENLIHLRQEESIKKSCRAMVYY